MFRRMAFVVSAVVLAGCGSANETTGPDDGKVGDVAMGISAKGGRAATGGVVFVVSQGLYYDTFVSQDPLPMQGQFQLIANGQTQYGPGQPGYLGGRWWEDTNGNGVQDAADHFFLCPLLGPGRLTP